MKSRSSPRSPEAKMSETRIRVGHDPFSVGEEYTWLAERDEDGAVVTFTGKVRNHNLGDSVRALTLEHYPGMTEKNAGGYCSAGSRSLAAGPRLGGPPYRRAVAGGSDCLRRRHQRASRECFCRRGVYYGLPEDPRPLLEARGDGGGRSVGRGAGERPAGGEALVSRFSPDVLPLEACSLNRS